MTTATKTHCVAWTNPSGSTHRGNPLTLDLAQAWVDDCNRRHPTIPHWVETCGECRVDVDAEGVPAAPTEVAALRAQEAADVRTARLKAAGLALEACGLLAYVEGLHRGAPAFYAYLDRARDAVVALRDGSDDARYAATGAAMDALGALWAVS